MPLYGLDMAGAVKIVKAGGCHIDHRQIRKSIPASGEIGIDFIFTDGKTSNKGFVVYILPLLLLGGQMFDSLEVEAVNSGPSEITLRGMDYLGKQM